MLEVFTTEEFADWFGALDPALAEDVATLVEVIEQLGPAKAAPGSRESLLWYEHPAVRGDDEGEGWLPRELEAWGAFHDYAHAVLRQLDSPAFAARLRRLGAADADAVLRAVRRIKRIADPRARWARAAVGLPRPRKASLAEAAEDTRAELRRLYFEVLAAAGLEATDVPEHSLALREVSRRAPAPAFRLLYGVHAEKNTALVVTGELLDRRFYGDSVRRAERTWGAYVAGTLRAVQPAAWR